MENRVIPRTIKYSTKLVIILCTILTIPVFLLGPLLFLPFLLYRWLLSLLSRAFNPHALSLMSPRNCVVAVDEVTTVPEQSIIVNIAFSGVIDFDRIYKVYEQAVCSTQGKERYPEFQRYYESWGGYLFWKQEEDFNFANHMRRYRGKCPAEASVCYEELFDFCLEYVRHPFPPKRSPWEIIIVEKFRHPEVNPHSDVTVLIFHVHHGLCDGYSILEFLTDAVSQWGDTRDVSPIPGYAHGAISPTWGQRALVLLTAPYYLVREGIGSFDINFFRVPSGKLKRKLQVASLKRPVTFVKEVKNKWDVSFSAVVYATISAGFRKYMIKNNLSVPEYFHVGMPFPWPGRKQYGLQNNMCVCILKLPVGTADPGERVRKCEKYWKTVKSSPVPLLNWTFMPLLGILPGPLLKLFVMNNVTTMVFSNFPGPQDRVHMLDTTSEDVEFVTGLWRGNCGIGIGLISANGMFKLNLGIDKGILESQSEVNQIIQFINEEFDSLAQGGATEAV